MQFFITHRLKLEWVGQGTSEVSAIISHKHNALLHNSPSKVENKWVGNNEKQGSFAIIHAQTHKHNALLHNSPSEIENGLDRKQGKLVKSYANTNTMHSFTTNQLKLMDCMRRGMWKGSDHF